MEEQEQEETEAATTDSGGEVEDSMKVSAEYEYFLGELNYNQKVRKGVLSRK